MIRILRGHVLDKLRELPAESVHCVVTSPPYFGLRSYGTEPQIWGGDPGCEHAWGNEQTAREESGRSRLEWSTGGNPAAKLTSGAVSQGGFCRHCNAWRGDLGLEPTLGLYLEHMVEIFREVRRVLRKDGTCWVNIGDSYAGSWGAQSREHAGLHASNVSALSANQVKAAGYRASGTGSITRTPGLKPKDLMLIPSRLAIRLQDDGWWVRSDIAWCKRAPMPESCTDRPTMAWEHVFLLTKSGNTTYWTHRDHAGSRTRPEPDYRWLDGNDGGFEYDTEPPAGWRDEILLKNWPGADPKRKRWSRINLWQAHDYFYDQEAVKIPYAREWGENNGGSWAHASRTDDPVRGKAGTHRGDGYPLPNTGANLRNYWLLGPEPYPESHFAVFPSEIPRICIKAGTSERGVCPKCGAPWGRVLQSESRPNAPACAGKYDGVGKHRTVSGGVTQDYREKREIGWQPTCSCDVGDPVPATVLDCFFGAGTTGLVADQLQRNCIGIELSAAYAGMAERRLRDDNSLFLEVAPE